MLYELLDQGKISLSVISLVKEHLNDQNQEQVLQGISGLTCRQTEAWLAARFPKPDVPDSVRKLPAPNKIETAAAAPGTAVAAHDPVLPVAQRQRGPVQPLSTERYRVTFTADRALRDKLELAAV